MMLSLSSVLNFHAKIDADFFPINDAMLSIKDRKMVYLMLDTGPWFDSHLVLIEVGLIDTISFKEKSIQLLNDRAAVDRAPVLKGDSPLSLDSLPPIVIGPFGNTMSPLMMAAAILGPPQRADRRAQSIDTRFQRFSDIKGLDVFGKDGQLGHVDDLFVSADTFDICALQVANSKISPERQMLVPSEKLRHMADQETHLVLDVTSNELADVPELDATSMLDLNNLAMLRRHYQ